MYKGNEMRSKYEKMADGIKSECEEKLNLKEIEFEKLKITVAEAQACTAMETKDECNKEIEREEQKKSIKILKINYNQVLIDLKKKKMKLMR